MKEADDSYRLNISSDQYQTQVADEVYRLIFQSEVPKTECANIVLNLVVYRIPTYQTQTEQEQKNM